MPSARHTDKMNIGVLALQGDFVEHQKVLTDLGVQARAVRLPDQLENLDGLIIPGGESTTIGKLSVDFDLLKPLREFGLHKAIWGTCAGAIFISKDAHRTQPLLKIMDIQIERNAFGRQVDSFETKLEVPALCEVDPDPQSFHAVFIRAPLIERVAGDAEVLARLPSGTIVAARQGKLLATSFHPELTGDNRFHRYFLHLVETG
jgi:5'-phosphate synthase pdxT subunit